MTETTAQDTDLSKYEGQKVIVQVKLDTPDESGATLIEVEGKAEAANALGILIKPKGRTQVELIEASKIESVEIAPESEKKLAAKSLAIVDLGKARQHLLDRHGLTLDEANGLTEEAAFDYHNEVEHGGLGHKHEDKKAAEERAENTEQAAADSAA